MKMRNIFLFSFAVVWCASAKTIALWPLNYEEGGTVIDNRCRVDPANDLDVDNCSKGDRVPWDYPPNPDKSQNLLGDVRNRDSFVCTRMFSSTFGNKIPLNHDFTVEGWMSRKSNPGAGWFYVVGAQNGINSHTRWILSLRKIGNDIKWVLFCGGAGYVNDVPFPVLQDPDSTNEWQHIALTYSATGNGLGRGVWELFKNGVTQGCITNLTATPAPYEGNGVFDIGGRAGGNSFGGKFDYWRVSDAVLTTNEFLNAGDLRGTIIPTSPTVAYWKMDRTADGHVDLADSVGDARWTALITAEGASRMMPSLKCAFSNQPPNTTVTLPDGNFGSIYGQTSASSFRVPELGKQLELTNSFTVEGWMMPERVRNIGLTQYIVNTRIGSKGWALALRCLRLNGSNVWRMVIFAEDNGGVQVADAPLSGDLSGWNSTWKHVALTYDHTAGDIGQGVWSCWLDGERCGVATNNHLRSGTSDSSYFHLGGRNNDTGVFSGYLDCWRVSQSVLSPNQFLNAVENPVPATDVLALWPLNTPDGVHVDGTDVVGSYNFSSSVVAGRQVAVSADQALVTNPDGTPGFRGDPTANRGSILFSTPENVGSDSPYLFTNDRTLLDLLDTSNPYTLEGFFYRTANPGNRWQLIFALPTRILEDGVLLRMNFSYRQGGYTIWTENGYGLHDVSFPDSVDDTKLNVWRHVALTYNPVSNGVWELFLDGQSKGCLTNRLKNEVSQPVALLLGGRPSSANSFCGAVDSVRVSNVVLTPDRFLNANGYIPPEPAANTLAYWRLDSDGTSCDFSSQVESRYSFLTGANLPAGSTDCARRNVPRPDTSTNFIGDAGLNAGSVVFNGKNCLFTKNIGLRLDNRNTFTVEGWINWKNNTSNDRELITGTWRLDIGAGWYFSIDHDRNAPALHLYGKTTVPYQTPFVDAVFSYSPLRLLNQWHHLALTYQPFEGNGLWTLYVDGKKEEQVENAWVPVSAAGSPFFEIGGERTSIWGLGGGMDLWRVSEGALSEQQFLYVRPGGLWFYVR